jgi:hypothetical protein
VVRRDKLTELEEQTLVLMANKGPLTGYDLHSKKRGDGSGEDAETNIMSDPYWIKLHKRLLAMKLIEKYPEKGRRKPYHLSEDGFDLVLRIYLERVTDFDSFAHHYEDYFPLVLGYWEKLKKDGLSDYVEKSLGEMIGEIYLVVTREFILGMRDRYSHKEFVDDLTTRIYLPEIFYEQLEGPESIPNDKIINFRNSNPGIMDFTKKWINDEIKNTKKYAAKLVELKTKLNMQ